MKEPKILTVSEAGRRLGLSKDRVRQLSDLGKLRAMKTDSGQRIYFEDDVMQLAQERRLQLSERVNK